MMQEKVLISSTHPTPLPVLVFSAPKDFFSELIFIKSKSKSGKRYVFEVFFGDFTCTLTNQTILRR